jgi:ubiquitin thioesterase OTU1
MAGPLLRILIRLKSGKYHRMQIAARYRIIDLIKQIAQDLRLTIDQLSHISIYRNGPNGYSLLYPLNNTHYDTLDKYGLSSDEELYIDLTDLITLAEEEEEDDENFSLTTNTEFNTTDKNLSTGGELIRYPVPSDNSCLFSSIDFVLHSGKLDLSSNKYLRNLVATKIESDQNTYSEAILGRTNSDYCKWIRRGKIKNQCFDI